MLYLLGSRPVRRAGDEGETGTLPSFRLAQWQPGLFTKLPAPTLPFGLDLSAAPLTDAGLSELAGFVHLQSLELGDTQVTDAGLKELANLKQLRTLGLSYTKVSDAGLKAIAGLVQLRKLDIRFTQVTDAGLKELANLQHLERLALSYTQVTDAGMQDLSASSSCNGSTSAALRSSARA